VVEKRWFSGNNLYKRICIILVLSILTFSSYVSGEPGTKLKEKFTAKTENIYKEIDEYLDSEPSYSLIQKLYEKKGYMPTQNIEIILDMDSIVASSTGDIPLTANIGGRQEPVLLWTDTYDWFEWSVDITHEGLYEILMEYYTIAGSCSDVYRSIKIDNDVAFSEMNNIRFPLIWEYTGKPTVNNIGDEVLPRQEQVLEWRTTAVVDSEGKYAQPLIFYFSEGKHTIRMSFINQSVVFGNMIIKSPERIKTYDEVKNSYEKNGYNYVDKTIKFQAEEAVLGKSNQTIKMVTDGDPLTEPVYNDTRKLNAMGGWSWRKGNDTITWEFNIPEDGLYNIGFRAAQWWSKGIPVYRQIAIDDCIPFEDMLLYKFDYSKNWKMEILHDKDDEPYLFYFKKGEHKLTMTVKLGPIAEIADSLKVDLLMLSDILRQIIMLTGNNPDYNFEYELERNIPHLTDNLEILMESMQSKIDILNSISTDKPTFINDLLLIKDQLRKMIADPDSITRKLNDLSNTQTILGSWLLCFQDQPLIIDYVNIGKYDKKWDIVQSNILQKVRKTWQNFVRSFIKDYDSVGGKNTSKERTTLDIWVSNGKEWAEIMKSLADEDFTSKTGISINLNVLPSSQVNAGTVNALMLAVCSGEAPDIASGMAANSPVEFAIRDSVVDISQFSEFSAIVKDRFFEGVMIPFKYRNGYYALPETMNFNVLFYRKDIINELGIDIPQTWKEVYENVLPILYRNGMKFYCPQDFSTFLYQNNGKFYNETGTLSGLDTPEAYKAFKEWTELYTSYGVPVVSNFFSRMRTGDTPMGIGGYTNYIQFMSAAPELIGKWGIALIPGHEDINGNIKRASGGIEGQALVIMNQSKHKNEAWEFLKWWTSTDVQTRFGNELEALMGIEARWNTANKEAFKELPWKTEDTKIIMNQISNSIAQPVVLGGYFTNRHIVNAWNSVVLGGENVRDSLEKAVIEINKELQSKQEEYGVVN